MKIQTITQDGVAIALVESKNVLISDVASALDFAMSVRDQTGCDRIALNKTALDESFFKLSSCLAGDILQKYINYQIKLAIFGNYSAYTSKPLKDFIYESNKGRDFFFVATSEQAIDRLAQVK